MCRPARRSERYRRTAVDPYRIHTGGNPYRTDRRPPPRILLPRTSSGRRLHVGQTWRCTALPRETTDDLRRICRVPTDGLRAAATPVAHALGPRPTFPVDHAYVPTQLHPAVILAFPALFCDYGTYTTLLDRNLNVCPVVCLNAKNVDPQRTITGAPILGKWFVAGSVSGRLLSDRRGEGALRGSARCQGHMRVDFNKDFPRIFETTCENVAPSARPYGFVWR